MSDIIRASSLPGFSDCPRRWAARQIPTEITALGYTLRRPPHSIAAAVGTGVHGGAARALTRKMNAGDGGWINEIHDAAIDAFRVALAEGDVATDATTPNTNVAEKQIVRMVMAFGRGVVPYVNPVMVEERLTAQASPQLILSGQGDNLCREESEAGSGLRDLKTGVREGSHRPQLGAYSLLYRSHGIDVTAAWTDFIQRVPLAKPQPPVVSTRHDVAGCETACLRVIQHVTDSLELFRLGDAALDFVAGDPWAFLANPSSTLCSANWCPAYDTDFCKEHKAK